MQQLLPNHVHLVFGEAQFDSGHGTGTWAGFQEPIMTLTYRGQKYNQSNAAASNVQRPVLVYRGQKVAR